MTTFKRTEKAIHLLKKITIIFSFFLITFLSIGSFVFHLMRIESYRQNFRESLLQNNPGATSIIDLNPSQLYVNSNYVSWEDGNKEIFYNGKLYDIVLIKNNGVKVSVIAISDEQEMALNKEYLDFYNKTQQNSKTPFDILKNFFSLKYISLNSEYKFDNPLCKYISFEEQKKLHLKRVVIGMDIPPPR